MSLLAYCKLEILKERASIANQHQLKELLLIKANQAAMQELQNLKNQFKKSA